MTTGASGPAARLRETFARGATSYVRLVCALALNLPLLSLVLTRHLEEVPLMSLGGLYAQLVFVGYYGLILLVLLGAICVFTGSSRRLPLVLGGVVLSTGLAYLVINSFVHRIFRFHLDAFWFTYALGSFEGMGIPGSLLAALAGVLAAIAVIEWGILKLVTRGRPARVLAAGVAAAIVVAALASQAMHVIAYHRNDARITGITPQLPFYAPLVSQNRAARHDAFAWGLIAGDSGGESPALSLHYPLRPVTWDRSGKRPNILVLLLESWRADMFDARVTPHLAALERRSTRFTRHLSSGNSTPHGVFGLFYAIHPTYWTAVKANNAAIHNPVLIDVLDAEGYDFGIYADSQFGRHKIQDAMFRGIEVHEDFAGEGPDARDADMTGRLIEFATRERGGRPFFGFAFFKSTHYSYTYPESSALFQPAAELNHALAGNRTDVAPFLNDCRNAVHYADGLIGRIVAALEASGTMDETIVIVTSDHGEEFNDNRAGWWGHCGNFTRWQTQVPLLVWWPGRAPARVERPTTHVDVPTTLLARVFCATSPSDWSNGRDLFVDDPRPRPMVVGGYANHAYVMGEDVHAVYPVFVQSYRLSNIRDPAGRPDPALVRMAMDETRRFFTRAEKGSIAVR
jgi:hypothetical protein